MVENFAKGREKRKQLLEHKKNRKLVQRKRTMNKRRRRIWWIGKNKIWSKRSKKPRKKYTCKPKEEIQIISENSDSSSSEDYIVEKQIPKRNCLYT